MLRRRRTATNMAVVPRFGTGFIRRGWSPVLRLAFVTQLSLVVSKFHSPAYCFISHHTKMLGQLTFPVGEPVRKRIVIVIIARHLLYVAPLVSVEYRRCLIQQCPRDYPERQVGKRIDHSTSHVRSCHTVFPHLLCRCPHPGPFPRVPSEQSRPSSLFDASSSFV